MDKIISFTKEEINLLKRILYQDLRVKKQAFSLIGDLLCPDDAEKFLDDVRFVKSIYRKL